MAKITLKDKYGRVLAEIGEDDPVEETGETATIATKPANRVVSTETGQTGYVEEEVLETWTESTVQIPANFAGLESTMVPTRLRPQLFDIVSVDEQEGYVEITAVHMFYRQRQNTTTWVPGATTRYSGASACRNVLTNAMFDSGFNVASDSTDLIDGNRLDYENKNIVEAFLDPENGICAKWDLSMIRDNDVFYCLKNVGYDRGMVIQNKKNMIGVERTENVEETITRVAPVARDESGDLIWLSYNGKKYVDSQYISNYPAPKLEIYHTDLRVGENGVTTDNVQAKLLEAAQNRFSVDKVDIPEVTMTIEFVALGDTEEYAQYRNLDKAYLYDILHIKDTDRGYSYSAQVVGVQHNILTGVLESVTIGTPKKWNGVRKIGSWQVPEFNGGNIRPGSIRAGAFEHDAVRESDIAAGAIDASHMSASADGHFRTIFAEQLYISNTSEDGLLNTRFSVSEGNIDALVTKTGINSLGQNETLYGNLNVTATRVGMVVGTVNGSNYIKAAEIAVAINQSTGQSEARIDADHVYIGNDKSSTVIAGKTTLAEVQAECFNTTYLSSAIGQIALLSVMGLAAGDGISATNFVSGDSIEGNSFSIGGHSFTNLIVSASVSGNTLTLTPLTGNPVTFSKATALSGVWSGGIFTVTASPQGTTLSTELSEITTNGTPTVSGNYTMVIPCKVTTTDNITALTDNVTVSAQDAYNNGYNNAKLSGSWNNAKYTVTKGTTGDDSVNITVSASITYDSSTHKYTAHAHAGGAERASSTSGTAAYDAGYKAGYNEALSDAGIASGGTVYTATGWYNTLYQYPDSSHVVPVYNCATGANSHTLQPK